jgi:biopolymer transport protein ExbD
LKFYSKRRQRPAVPIVTLIDILAILLIFFIVTTTFKQRESLVQVTLPSSSELAADGAPLSRTALELGRDGSVALGGQLVPMEQLSAALLRFREAQPSGALELKADEGVPLGLMIGVWDAATRAGIEIGDLPLRVLLDR